MSSSQTVVCVLGMHRSGTSLVSRMVNLLGVDLGPEEHLMEPFEHNPTGFWENELIVELDDEILAVLGGSWRDLPPFPPGWERSQPLADLRRRARAILEEEFGDSKEWGWKDPRTCVTLPFWQEVIGGELRYVICFRNPVDVARSLERDVSFEQGLALWFSYVHSTLAHTRGRPRIFVFYEDLMDDWRPATERLAGFLGKRSPAKQGKTAAAIAEYLKDGLWHHRTTAVDALDQPAASFQLKAVYLALRLYVALEERHGPAVDGEALEQALDILSLEAAESLAAGEEVVAGEMLLQELAEVRDLVKHLATGAPQEAIAREVAARAVATSEIARLQESLVQTRGELERQLTAREAVERRVTELAAVERRVTELAAKLEETGVELRRHAAGKEAAEKALAALQELGERQAADLRRAVERPQAELARQIAGKEAAERGLATANERWQRESAELRKLLEERQAELMRQTAGKEAAESDLTTANERWQRESAELRKLLEERQAELMRQTAGKEAAESDLATANEARQQETAELRALLAKQAAAKATAERGVATANDRWQRESAALREQLARQTDAKEAAESGLATANEGWQRESTETRELLRQRQAELERQAAAKNAAERGLEARDGAIEELRAELREAVGGKIRLLTQFERRSRVERELRELLLDAHDQLFQRDTELVDAVETLEAELERRVAELTKAREADGRELKHLRYQLLLPRVRAFAEDVIPPSATTIVVSRGDDELLKLNGREGWHFPQAEDGRYAGYYPADSETAIAELEALRARGGKFVLFPSTAAWWLDHYPGLKEHLDARYQIAGEREDTGLIFDLRDRANGNVADTGLQRVQALLGRVLGRTPRSAVPGKGK